MPTIKDIPGPYRFFFTSFGTWPSEIPEVWHEHCG